jgi:recombination protein RecA
MPVNERVAQLEKIFKEMNKDSLFSDQYSDDELIVKLGNRPSKRVPTISSGSVVLDAKLGGGFGRGRVVEIYGPESSGKTTFALTAVGNVQSEGGTALFIDAENALDLIVKAAESRGVDIIVLDSVAALIPRKELEGVADDQTIGVLARLMSKMLKRIVQVAANTGTTVIFINQTREKIGVMYGNPETTTGGNALKFYCTQRIRMSRGKPIMEGKNTIGLTLKFKIVKNKIAPPFAEGETVLSYGHGINLAAEIVLVGPDYGIITKNGNTLYETETGEKLGVGRAKATATIESDPSILVRLRKALKKSIEEADEDPVSSQDDEDDAPEAVDDELAQDEQYIEDADEE